MEELNRRRRRGRRVDDGGEGIPGDCSNDRGDLNHTFPILVQRLDLKVGLRRITLQKARAVFMDDDGVPSCSDRTVI